MQIARRDRDDDAESAFDKSPNDVGLERQRDNGANSA